MLCVGGESELVKYKSQILYWLLAERLLRPEPRPGWFGAVLRWLHLPWGWVPKGLDDNELKFLQELANKWNI